jgi:hypothetical protein
MYDLFDVCMTPMIGSILGAIMLSDAVQCIWRTPVHRALYDDKECVITNTGTDAYDRQLRIRRTSHIRGTYRADAGHVDIHDCSVARRRRVP